MTSNTDIFLSDDADAVLVRTDGMNEPAVFPIHTIATVLDSEGDVWVRDTESVLFYLPGDPYNETQEEADTTLAEIVSEHGLADINVPAPRSTEPEVIEPAPTKFVRGDITSNLLSGREALVLDVKRHAVLGTIYTVIEKGYSYPGGCSPTPGAATFPEFMLGEKTGTFNEAEVHMLTLLTGLGA